MPGGDQAREILVKTLVIAPHPDDETIGCGGTLLRLKAEGSRLAWMIVTEISEAAGWNANVVKRRCTEIQSVAKMVGFDRVFELGFPAAGLDVVPGRELVSAFGDVFREFQPEQVFVPNRSDVHTDHRLVFDAAAACSKWFRYASVKRVLAYETVSETDFALDSESAFQPNYYVDIEHFLSRKLEIMSVYGSEIGRPPFPRSIENVKALALVRGSSSGFVAAEAFKLLRERL